MTRRGTRGITVCFLASALFGGVGCGSSTPGRDGDAGRDAANDRDASSDRGGDAAEDESAETADAPPTPDDAPVTTDAIADAVEASADVATTDADASAGSDGAADKPPVDAASDGTSSDASDLLTGFDLPGVIKLVPDPKAGLLYALTTSQVVVFDIANKKELTRVDLGAISTDLDLSPDGSLLVAAQDRSKRLAVIDKQAWTVKFVGVRVDPQMVEAANGNVAYYVTLDQFTEVHQVDLQFGVAGDVKLNPSLSEPDLELSAAGDRLFIGETRSSGSDLEAWDLTVAPARIADHTSWDDDYGFYNPPRSIYLGPSEKNLYYAGHQLNAKLLAHALGDIGKVYAEDAKATFAVAAHGLIDVGLRTFLTTFPKDVTTAALVAGDSEVWSYEPYAERLSFARVADLIGGKALGVRVTTAADLSTYSFSKLVADPVRPTLYGLDAGKSVLVSIDSATGAARNAAVIEYGAKDVEIDAAGKFIYVGHSGMAIEQIDAATLALVKYIFAPRDSFDLAVASNDRVVSLDYDQWTTATLIDATTEKVLTSRYGSREGAVATTADGKTLFVASTDASDLVTRYDVSAGTLLSGTQSDKLTVKTRSLAVTPDGTSVYFADSCLNGTNLKQIRYAQTDRIFSISPNSLLAASATKIYRVSDGMTLMTLPSTCAVQAISPDGGTLHCYGASGLTKVSLAGLQ